MIKLTGVSHYYQRQPTLQELSVVIEQGEFVYVLGKSGAGKSTLIKLIYNEVLASSGEVMVAGYHLMRLSSDERGRFRQEIAIIFQDFKLLERYTVAENLAYPLQVRGVSEAESQKRVRETLAFVELSEKYHYFPGELSGGEQQRIAIARGLITQPKVLIADEPTGNLDPRSSRLILKLFEKINLTGTTILMVTHDQTLVAENPQRTLTIEQGKLVADSASLKGRG